MTGLDAAIVLAFAAWAIAAGLRARRRASEGLEEYFLAGRSLRGWQAGASMAATQFAADTPLLVTGLVATAGIFSLWRLWVYAIAFLLLGFVLAASWRRAGVLTDAELCELRYTGRAAAALRVAKAVYLGTLFNAVVLAMVLFAAKEIAEPFLLWHQWLPAGLFEPFRAAVELAGVPFASASGSGDLWVRSADNALSLLAIAGVTTLYATSGGLRGVVRTDLAQLAVMLLATAAYAVFLLDALGGLAALPARVAEAAAAPGGAGLAAEEILAFTPDRARDAGAALLAVLALQWLVQVNADGSGYLAQRTMACRSDRDARVAALVFTGLQVVLRSLLWLPIALALLVLLPPAPDLAPELLRAEREASFVRGIERFLPPGWLGLMLTALLAALASTLDSHLNWGASYWAHDLYGRFWSRGVRGREPSPRRLVLVARLSNALLLVLALAVLTQLSSIQVAWQVSLLFGAGTGVMLVLRWLWWRVSARGELAALVASLVLAPLLLAALPDREALRLLCMAAGATAAGIAASLLAGPEPRDALLAFYARARPPGFWGPVARALGEDPREPVRRLARGLGATVAGALACFAALTASGSWLIASPAPRGIAPGVWIGALFALALVAAPLAWRLGFGRAR